MDMGIESGTTKSMATGSGTGIYKGIMMDITGANVFRGPTASTMLY